MSSFISITSGNEYELKQAVACVGPVAVAVDADNKAFRVSLIQREGRGRGERGGGGGREGVLVAWELLAHLMSCTYLSVEASNCLKD